MRDQARNKYRELSDEKNNLNSKYGRNRYRKMSKGDKERLKEYQKNCREAKKSRY